MIIRVLVLIIGVVFASTHARGESTVGNGGTGVRVGDQIVLLDLLEAGVSDAPVYVKNSLEPAGPYSRISEGLGFLLSDEKRILAIKLTEIRSVNPFLADVLAIALQRFAWRLVPEALVPIEEAHSALILDPSRLVQLAIRTGSTIRINKDGWRELDAVNRVALVIHEVAYGVLPPQETAQGVFSQDGLRARELTGYLFSDDLLGKGWSGLMEMSPVGFHLSRIEFSEVPFIEFEPNIRVEYEFTVAGYTGRNGINLSPLLARTKIGWNVRQFCEAVTTPPMADIQNIEVTYDIINMRPVFRDYVSQGGTKRYLLVNESDADGNIRTAVAKSSLQGSKVQFCQEWLSERVDSSLQHARRFR